MLVKLIGWLWIAGGVLFLLKPDILKNRLKKKGLRKVKRILFSIATAGGIFLIIASGKMDGVLAKIMAILGIVAIIKGVFLLKSKLSEKLLDWAGKQSLVYFRILSLLYILIGVVILSGIKK